MPAISYDFGAVVDTDPRGNRLEGYKVRRRNDGQEFYVCLRGAPEIVEQVPQALAGWNFAPLDRQAVDPDHRPRWTHVYRFHGPYTTVLRDLLDLLGEVLTLRRVPELRTVLAMDFYKIPDDDVPPQQWPDTEAGHFVNVGKYWTSDPAAQVHAGRGLSSLLADAICRHPTYAAADRIVAVPGTNHDFGERLAYTVGKYTDKPVTTAVCQEPRDRPAKEGNSWGLSRYSIPVAVAGESVIIVDDVYRSGGTMRGVASAALGAGARDVLGLVGARTMRSN